MTTTLLTIEEALAAVLAASVRLASEAVPLDRAAGRVLAAPARASVDLPPFPSSAMDGFAVRSGDAPGPLRVVAQAAAGRPAGAAVGPGEAIAVATGAVVPSGADAVVPVENVVNHDNGTISIPPDVVRGAHVRPRGGDVERGGEVVSAGTRLASAHVGALAAAGVAAVECARRPAVALLTTGTELREAGARLGDGEIYESNGTMLAAALAVAGAAVERLPPVPDDEESHRAAIARGLDADVLVTSGGVSVGAHDLVRRVERELGVEERFWGVAMRPGKPLSFGTRGATLVFGLPGNPVSSLVGAMLFVRPALLALQGCADPGPAYEHGVLAASLRRAESRDDLVRARVERTDSDTVLWPVVGQESHMIVRAASADALVHVPRGDGELPAGAAVRYLRLD